MSNFSVGRIAELRAQIAGYQREWDVFTDPGGNGGSCDVIYGVQGALIRVQVKTVTVSKSDATRSVSIVRKKVDRITGVGAACIYKPTDFDFLIGAASENEYWVFPMSVIQQYTRRISLGITAQKFRNAFHLIEQEAARRSTATYLGAAAIGLDPDPDPTDPIQAPAIIQAPVIVPVATGPQLQFQF